MSPRLLCIIIVVLLSAYGAYGDYCIKRASIDANPLQNRWFLFGVCIFGSLPLGWVLVMRHLSLTSIGVFYCISTIFFLAAIDVFIFNQRLSITEYIAVGLGILSFVLLGRFS